MIANRPSPYRAPKWEIWEIPFLGPKKGLLGGSSWSHLNNPPGIFNSPFNKDLLRGGGIKYTRRVIQMAPRGAPQKSLFGSQKWYFPDFPFRGSVGGRPVRNPMTLTWLGSLEAPAQTSMTSPLLSEGDFS